MVFVRKMTIIFKSVRPFVYTRHGKCLFDSLTLTYFLSSYGVCPTLVFGVRVNPFQAHAWVQHGSYTLNTTPEYSRRFTPILAA
jgi:hypothetical protein